MIAEAANMVKDFFSIGKETPSIYKIGKDFISAYRNKSGASDGEVLYKMLGKYLSKQMDETTIYNTTKAISEGVEDYDAALGSMNASQQRGVSREEWMQENLVASAPGETIQEKGEYLYEALRALRRGNGSLMGEEMTIEAENIEWDEESVERLAAAVAQEAAGAGVLSGEIGTMRQIEGLAAVAGASGGEAEEEGFFERHGKTLKLAGSGVLTVCTRLGKIPFLSKATDVRVLTGAACAGIETLKAGYHFMKGKISSSEVVDRIADAVSVGLPGIIKKGVQAAALAFYPPAGVAAKVVGDGVLEAVSQKVANVAAKGLKAAKPLIAAAAEQVRSQFNLVKEAGKAVFNFAKSIFA